MLDLSKLQNVLNQYFIRYLTHNGTLCYQYSFTDKLFCCVVIGSGLIEDYLHLEKVEHLAATIWMEKDTSGLARSTFGIDQAILISDESQVTPMSILHSYYGHYNFDTGREIDETYRFFIANNVYVGKNNPVAFLQQADALNHTHDAWKRSGFSRDFIHHVELPARKGTYSLLTLTYRSGSADFATHRYDTHLVYSAYDENYKPIDTSGNVSIMLDALVEDYKGWENITTAVLMEEISAPWMPAAEAIFSYSMRCVTIDNLLNDL